MDIQATGCRAARSPCAGTRVAGSYGAGLAVVATACALSALPRTSLAQSLESDVTPESAHLVRDPSHYAIPDAAAGWLERLRFDDHKDRFSIKPGLAILTDYTGFRQDAASLAQVGRQDNQFEVRSFRVSIRGHFELFRRWDYNVGYEYKGFNQNPGDPDWNASDFYVTTLLGPQIGTLKIGMMKELFAYEMVGDAANLPQPERWLSPFFQNRNVGVTLSNTVLGQRGTWAIGWWNDWWQKGDSWSTSGNDFGTRVTGLPIWSDNGATYLHLAASARYYGADNGQLRYRGRPASNVADYYVDTGNIPGDHAWHGGLEALLNVRGYSILAEYVRASLDTYDRTDPVFDGYYVTASWVVTGEHRPYDRKAGYARRVLPQHPWGAVELIARFGRVDATDKGIDGGEMRGWWAGVNWWVTRHAKASVTYGDIDLNRGGTVGNTKTLLTRLQWIY